MTEGFRINSVFDKQIVTIFNNFSKTEGVWLNSSGLVFFNTPRIITLCKVYGSCYYDIMNTLITQWRISQRRAFSSCEWFWKLEFRRSEVKYSCKKGMSWEVKVIRYCIKSGNNNWNCWRCDPNRQVEKVRTKQSKECLCIHGNIEWQHTRLDKLPANRNWSLAFEWLKSNCLNV